MSKMEPVRIAIIGCGIAARKLHWPALRQMKHLFEVVVVCNHTETKARTFSELAGNVPYVMDYREVLANADVEAVDIVLPIHLNYPVSRDALLAGKHVIVEKPLASSLADAKAMLALEATYDTVTMVAENFRYHGVFQELKEQVAQRTIGKPYAAFWNVFYKINPAENEYARTQWRIDHQYPGGFVTDAGIHNIAALRHILGDVIPGAAVTKSVNRAIGEIDSMIFNFSTSSGVRGVFNFFASTNGLNRNELVILGTEGTATVTDNKMLSIRQDDRTLLERTVGDDFGFVSEFEAFYQAIRKKQPVSSSFSEGYLDFEVMITALQSAGKWR